ncbi:MAG: hypothetical protein WAN51_12410 [Alphaproteobacteria bacterium]
MSGHGHDPRKSKSRPAVTEQGRASAAARNERLAEALRDNLRRRKAQSRTQIRAKTGAGKPDGPKSENKS